MAVRSGLAVAGLTAAALAAVGVLGYQAHSSAPPPSELHGTKTGAAAPHHPSRSSDAKSGRGSAARKAPHDPAVPAASGSGKRVVYSLAQHRVWLVPAGAGQAPQTFPVAPSTVSPPAGSYAVTSRDAKVTGSDGVPIEHVVRFTVVHGVTVGFSAAVDGSSPKPSTGAKTGGIRERRADGAQLWQFAPVRTRVVVVR